MTAIWICVAATGALGLALVHPVANLRRCRRELAAAVKKAERDRHLDAVRRMPPAHISWQLVAREVEFADLHQLTRLFPDGDLEDADR